MQLIPPCFRFFCPRRRVYQALCGFTRAKLPFPKIITARDLNEARTAFVEVSAELITVIDHVGTTGGTTLFTAHCPMAFGGKGADWVQGDKKVMNPYFGGKMPHCGSINDQVAGKMSDKVDAKLPPGGQHAHGNP